MQSWCCLLTSVLNEVVLSRSVAIPLELAQAVLLNQQRAGHRTCIGLRVVRRLAQVFAEHCGGGMCPVSSPNSRCKRNLKVEAAASAQKARLGHTKAICSVLRIVT